MFCMNCGQELPAGAKFCFNCGSKVEVVSFNNEETYNSGAECNSETESHYDEPEDECTGDYSDWTDEDFREQSKLLVEQYLSKSSKEVRDLFGSPELRPYFETMGYFLTLIQLKKFATAAEKAAVEEKIAVVGEKISAYLKRKDMPSHQTYYNFVGVRDWSNVTLKASYEMICSEPLVWEYEGYLYYAWSGEYSYEFHKLSLDDKSRDVTIAKFNRKINHSWFEQEDEKFHLGTHACFCVSNGKIYLSRPQIEGRTMNNNEIWSIDLSNNYDLKKEFELNDAEIDYTLRSPYVIGDKVIVSVFRESRYIREERILLDKAGNKKIVAQFMSKFFPYLSINEEGFICGGKNLNSKYGNAWICNYMSDDRRCVDEVYNGSGDKKTLYIDAQKDILYYLEKEDDTCGSILGMSKSGEIVDRWEPIRDRYFLEVVRRVERGPYSVFSFDGNLRVFKITAEMPDNKGNRFIDCIFTADRDGKCEERFYYAYKDKSERYFSSVLHIHTPNAVVLHLKRNNEYMEYMVTLTGERIVKPLFS